MRIFTLLLLFAAVLTAESYGHRIHIFAEVAGMEISGYVYYSDGKRARDVSVSVVGTDGTVISQVRTNQQGVFQFFPDKRMDFTLTAETTDGHLAEWKVRANELPEFLPPPDVWREGASNPTSADVKNENLQLRMMIREELKPLVAQFTRRSERLERILNEVRWRDVVGGIGYLVGITGIVCYLKRGKSQRQG